MKLVKKFARSLSDWVPADNLLLYRACRAYVDRFNGDNNDDIETSGERRLLEQVLPDCKVVFDVGANVGEWTKLALSINPNLQVHCFEPSATTFARVAQNNFPSSVVLNDFGLSSAKREAGLHVIGEAAGTNSSINCQGAFDSAAYYATETVNLDTLDIYCYTRNVRRIDFLNRTYTMLC